MLNNAYKLPAWLFYLLNCSWGIIMTAIGAIVTLILIILGYKPKKHMYCIYTELPGDWGGLELGLFFITSRNPSLHIKNHEHGHAIQNAIFGPIFPFLIGIPSAIRYWYRELKYYRKNDFPPTAYDDIWFEGQASHLGHALFNRITK